MPEDAPAPAPLPTPPRYAPPFPWRLFLVAVIAVCVVGIVAIVAARWPRGAGGGSAHTSTLHVTPAPAVIVAIQEMARLETVSYHVERVVELSDQQTQLWGLIEAEDRVMLIAAGDVVAGLDLARITASDATVDWEHRRIHLRAPAPQIFSTVVDSRNTHIHSRNTDLLASRRADLEDRARSEAERAMQTGAIEHGILDRAQRSADHSLRSLLGAMGFQDVVIEFAPVVPRSQ